MKEPLNHNNKKINIFFWIMLSFLFLILYPSLGYAQSKKGIKLTKIQEAREDISYDSTDANAHYNLGLALMRTIETSLHARKMLDLHEQKIADEAEESFKKALFLTNNAHGRAAIMLSMLLRFQKQYEAAIPYAQIGLQLPPESQDYTIAVDVIAACYTETGKTKEALDILKEALQYHPDDSVLQEDYDILSSKLENELTPPLRWQTVRKKP